VNLLSVAQGSCPRQSEASGNRIPSSTRLGLTPRCAALGKAVMIYSETNGAANTLFITATMVPLRPVLSRRRCPQAMCFAWATTATTPRQSQSSARRCRLAAPGKSGAVGTSALCPYEPISTPRAPVPKPKPARRIILCASGVSGGFQPLFPGFFSIPPEQTRFVYRVAGANACRPIVHDLPWMMRERSNRAHGNPFFRRANFDLRGTGDGARSLH